MTPVVRSLRCGHLMKTECHVDTHTLVCILECGKDLPCGHKCAQPCGHADKCGTSCKEEVKKTVLKCRHTPCHTITVRCDKNIDEELCKQPCTSKLQCGHKCLGTCNDCQSVLSGGSGNGSGSGSPMVHKACSEPCRKALSCNHKCNGRHQCGDNSRCPPCLEPCAVKCIHRECELNCGVPCIPCEEQCSYSCPHMYCSMICCEPHYCILIGGAENTDMAAGEGLDSVCNERCRSNLKCGHRCQGFCGETCPSVCISCEPYQKLAVNDRLIALGCGHVFEDQFLHAKIMSEESGSQLKVPSCPTCQKTISGTHRYSSLVRKRLKSLEPEALRRFEEHLCREFEADDSPADPKIKELTAMLTSHSSLAQTLYLLLGKLYFQSDLILRSELFLNKALNAPTPWVRTEALTCLGYLKVCDGIPDDQFTTCVETSTERVLESALSYFTQIKGSTSEETVSREIFGRTTPCIAATVAKINEELLKLRFNKQAIAQAAEAARRQHNTRPSTRSSTAPPVERVTLLFPVPAAPSPLLVAVPASGGSSLHSAAAAGNIVKVINPHSTHLHINFY